jgi:membrane protein implicated in regulation of membrane protease activity
MSWEGFYLVVFLVGFLLSVVSYLAGIVHLPYFHFHGPGHPQGTAAKGGLSPFNFGTLAAFLSWFGGTGYLLERYSTIWVYLGLLVAALAGLAGAAVVFWFLTKLVRTDDQLDPADYDMVGVFGQVASPIRAGGTGELIYKRAGARRAVPARSENDAEIPRDTEVIVTRFEKGIAYVRRWDELGAEHE